MAARARRQPAPDPLPIAAPPVFGAYTINDLRSLNRCRFICSADGEPTLYCGRPVAPRASGKPSSWCAEHLAIVFVTWQRGGNVVRKAEGA